MAETPESQASNAADNAAKAAQSAGAEANKAVNDAAAQAKQASGNAANKAASTAQSAAQQATAASDEVKRAVDDVVETAGNAETVARQEVGEAVEKTAAAATKAADAAKEAAGAAKAAPAGPAKAAATGAAGAAKTAATAAAGAAGAAKVAATPGAVAPKAATPTGAAKPTTATGAARPATASREPEAPAVAPKGVTRREFLNYVWGASMTLFLAQFAGISFFFAMPRFRPGEFGGKIVVRAEDFPQTNAAPVPNNAGKFWLVNTDTGINAIYKVCTHLGCIYDWSEAAGIFACPCHGSQFKLNGDWITGPAPRNLDRFTFEVLDSGGGVLTSVTNGEPIPMPPGAASVLVNTGQRILGKSHF